MTTGDYQLGDLLGSKYTVRKLLGRGSTGATYKVLSSSECYAIRTAARRLLDWLLVHYLWVD